MSNDRFKFRVWDKIDSQYCPASVFCVSDMQESDDSIVIEQCTGLKDQTGKLIYEGDICKDSIGNEFVVTWDAENARFLGFTLPAKRLIYVGREPKAKIIGNIHGVKP